MNAINNNHTKLPPIHPGEILSEDFLIPLGITRYHLAKAIGVDPTRIHSIVLGTRAITAETALLLIPILRKQRRVLDGIAGAVRSSTRRRRVGRTIRRRRPAFE